MISVVTVTYGNRWEYLQQTVTRLMKDQNVSRIIVVDNGSSYDLKFKLNELRSVKIQLLPVDVNKGSAFGFKYGITHLLGIGDTSFIYLLDDDNLILENSIEYLNSFWESSSLKSKNSQLALLSLRNDRKYLIESAGGRPLHFLFPNGNLFLGFDILRFPQIFFYKMRNFFLRKRVKALNPVKIPMAPYGGLFFHRDIISTIGLPYEPFFAYTDDFSLTSIPS